LILGVGEIAISPVTGNLAVRYVGHTSGVDSLTYQICDTSSVCDTATVRIHLGISDCTILGTEDADQLEGTPGDNIICGIGGNDTIAGNAGDDIIRGGAGNHSLQSNAGSDILFGGADGDVIYGGDGYDTLAGEDKVGERQPTDRLYYDSTRTPVTFDELTDTEAEALDTAISECRQATPNRAYFQSRDTRSKCADMLASLCRNGASQKGQQPDTDNPRYATFDFICYTTHMAELGEQGYLIPHDKGINPILDTSDRYQTRKSINNDILALYDTLTQDTYTISETTAAKLREFTQTINRFATQAYQKRQPIIYL